MKIKDFIAKLYNKSSESISYYINNRITDLDELCDCDCELDGFELLGHTTLYLYSSEFDQKFSN